VADSETPTRRKVSGSAAERVVRDLLTRADVAINGTRPWDIVVHNKAFYARVVRDGAVGLGESYMDGWWDAAHLDQFFFRVLRAGIDSVGMKGLFARLLAFKSRVANMQSRRRAKKVARQHYDLSVDLYESFLDPYNQYTCGYFNGTDDLNVAQEKKLDLICRKLRLSSSDRVLDIGCGWGGFARFAATRYGAHVTGITISDEQYRYARQHCAGLPVEIHKEDYREVSGRYDKVLVCGMIEHVGYKNFRHLMEVVRRVIADTGLFLIHTIGSDVSTRHGNPWSEKYIFPNSMLPSIRQLGAAIEGLFTMEDWHNFSASYDPTLMAWFRNFDRNWSAIEQKYGSRFYRMWKYYLLSFAGAFRARSLQLWQVVLATRGIPGGYEPVR